MTFDEDFTDFTLTPVRRSLPQHRPASLTALLHSGPEFMLHITDTALAGMQKHAAKRPSEEVGGVLLGRHYTTDDRYVVVVTEHVEVPSQSKSAVHFDFDHTSIAAIFTQLEQSGDEYVIGWYHSHVTGTPFMSQMDLQVHRDHFNEPWYIACVVGIGEPGTPAGFWRMLDDELVPVDDYRIQMSSPGTAAERHQRFLQTYQPPTRVPVAGLAASVLPVLGLAEDSVVGSALRTAVELERAHLDGFASLRLILDIGARLTGEPGAASEIAQLREHLDRVVSYQDSLHPALRMAELSDMIAMHDDIVYVLRPEDNRMLGVNLANAAIRAVQLPFGARDLRYGPDGDAWLLRDQDHVVRLTGIDASDRMRLAYELCHLHELGIGEAAQLVAGTDRLVLCTANEVLTVPFHHKEDATTSFGDVSSVELPPGNGRLMADNVGDPDGQAAALLLQHRGALNLWDVDNGSRRRVAELALPAPWRPWRLRDAVIGRAGIFALFDDTDLGQLVLLDPATLEVIRHYVRDVGAIRARPMTRLCGDGSGGVYARIGKTLYRVLQ